MSSTDQTHDEQLGTDQHRFGRSHDDDDVLEGHLIEPEPRTDEDPAAAVADDPDRPVDDPIVMDATPVDPEDDRVVLDSRDDAPDADTMDPASPAAAGYQHGGTTTGSAIPMPGGPAADDASPVETTMDDGTLDGTATGSDAIPAATPVTATSAGTADVSRPVPTAETNRLAGHEQWHEIMAMFVDDPREATQRAASLVDSSVESLLASMKQRQQSMQSDWQGDGADTEKLRTALQGYRAFWAHLEEFSHQA